jgi:hypothetical protein
MLKYFKLITVKKCWKETKLLTLTTNFTAQTTCRLVEDSKRLSTLEMMAGKFSLTKNNLIGETSRRR